MSSSGLARPAISMRDVHLSLGRGAARVHILKGISLDIGEGEAVGLIGPSGSGKSTLLMTMAGLERPDSGEIRIAGSRIDQLDEDALARFRGERIGIVFQSFHLIPTMTALENVAIPLELAGRSDAFEAAKRELQAVGLGERLSHYPGQCLAVSSNVWRWRVPLRPTRRFSSLMNQPAIWMKHRARPSLI